MKTGKFGAFVGCSNYPDCRYTRQFTEQGDGPAEAQTPDGKQLGFDPDTGLAVSLRSGRFGAYLQLGDGAGKDDKPKRASIPKGVDANTIDLERALQLLSLPREVGAHPEGGTIEAGLGRFGPYIKHNGTFASLESLEDVFTVGINRAVTILAEKAAGGGKGRFQRAKPTVLKDLGEHPDGGKIEVLSGKYGPYVSHNKVYATLPRGKEPASVTVTEALQLLAERIAKGGGSGGAKKGRKAPAKSAKSAGDGGAPAAAAKGGKARGGKTATKPAKGKTVKSAVDA